MEETVTINNFSDCYIRLVITRGIGYLGLNPNKCPDPIGFYHRRHHRACIRRRCTKRGCRSSPPSVVRTHPNSLSPRIKSLNYLNNILAKIEATDAGVPEAVLLNQEGNVAECTGDNIFIVRDGEVQTPTTSDGILEGVTRQVMIELCRKLSIPCVEKTLQRHDFTLPMNVS